MACRYDALGATSYQAQMYSWFLSVHIQDWWTRTTATKEEQIMILLLKTKQHPRGFGVYSGYSQADRTACRTTQR